MKRIVILVLAFGMVVAGLSTAALSQEDNGELPPHGHLLLQGMQFDEDGEPIGFRRCQELAAGRAVPNHAHHDNLHDYRGKGHQGLQRAGHWVIPTAPLTPWTNCQEFVEFLQEQG